MTKPSECSPIVLEDATEEITEVGGDGGVAAKLKENARMTGDLAMALQGSYGPSLLIIPK